MMRVLIRQVWPLTQPIPRISYHTIEFSPVVDAVGFMQFIGRDRRAFVDIRFPGVFPTTRPHKLGRQNPRSAFKLADVPFPTMPVVGDDIVRFDRADVRIGSIPILRFNDGGVNVVRLQRFQLVSINPLVKNRLVV